MARAAVRLAQDDACEARALLGVSSSLSGRRWVARLSDERIAYQMAEAHGIPEGLARILAGRNIAIGDVERTLNPSLKEQLPDPSGLRDMDAAADRVAHAIQSGERVCVFGDYDVDGATSSAILKLFFDAAGGNLNIYIPDRIVEGYGPNIPALTKLAQSGVTLVIMVDCGTQSFAALEAARALGLDVVVVDHHQAGEALPPAFALVNPNRVDDISGLGHVCAAGLSFLLTVAVNRALRAAGWYRGPRSEPDLVSLIDLVALGTVCDVVPLAGLNRVFVARGLAQMARTRHVGLKALAAAARMDGAPSCYHLGFLLGPRVNAGGRVGAADLGARLLTTGDAIEARGLADRLDILNQERQAIEALVLEDAIAKIELGDGRLSAFGPIVVAGEGWHPGVVGIVASRLKERYNRPAVVIGINDGVGKGSGRSVSGVDLGCAVRAAQIQGILVNGGGHAMAAGLTVAPPAVANFAQFLDEALAGDIEAACRTSLLKIDGVLDGGFSAREAADMIDRGAPYGAGFPEPVFAVADARVAFVDTVGNGHVALTVETSGARLRAIAFRAADTAVGKGLLTARNQSIHLAGRLKADRKGGAELILADAAPAAG